MFNLIEKIPDAPTKDTIVLADNLEYLALLPSNFFQMIYIDPPFNTGNKQVRKTLKVKRDANASRQGFQGQNYQSQVVKDMAYDDATLDFIEAMQPRIQEALRVLHPTGTLYFHIDYREAHYAKIMLDAIFGRVNFLNEIIWAYDYGAKSKKRWPTKHDTILVYVKDINQYYFDSEAVDREPYMAPGLVTPAKAAKGKLPTDVWWHTIVATNGKEKTGYPTQKPEGIVRRMILASTRPGDWCLDFFAGSGTLGAVAQKTNRHFVLVDSNLQAYQVMQQRLKSEKPYDE